MSHNVKTFINAVIITVLLTTENYFVPDIYYSFAFLGIYWTNYFLFKKTKEKFTFIQLFTIFIVFPITFKIITMQLYIILN